MFDLRSLKKIFVLTMLFIGMSIQSGGRNGETPSFSDASVSTSAGEIVTPIDVLLIADATRNTECSNGCDIWLKGPFQTMLISLDDEGQPASKPTILEYDVDFNDLYQVRLRLDEGYSLLKIGDYYYGVWMMSDGGLVFGTTQSDRKGGIVFMGGGSTGTAECPDSTTVMEEDCNRLSDGSVHIYIKEHVYDCNGNLKDVVITEIRIPPNLASQVSCRP